LGDYKKKKEDEKIPSGRKTEMGPALSILGPVGEAGDIVKPFFHVALVSELPV